MRRRVRSRIARCADRSDQALPVGGRRHRPADRLAAARAVGGTRPGYDPYGWLVWGKLTIHLKLDTNGAPSWKPLPFLFTVPVLTGRSLRAVAVDDHLGRGLAEPARVRLADRVHGSYERPPRAPLRRVRRRAVRRAACSDCRTIRDYTHYIFSAAVRHDDRRARAWRRSTATSTGRYRWAFWMWMLGALGRPEVWPFLGSRRCGCGGQGPERRWMVGFGLLLLPLFWFGIPATHLQERLHRRQHRPELAAGAQGRQDHRHDPPVPRSCTRTALWLAAFLGTAIAFVRRDRAIADARRRAPFCGC